MNAFILRYDSRYRFLAVSGFTLLLLQLLALPGLVARGFNGDADSAEKAVDKKGNELTLSQAIQRVLEHNPDLAPFKWEIKGRDGTIQQQSLRPNPEVSLEIENIAGIKDTRWLREAETTLMVSQPLLLGGKRDKRIQAATLNKTIAVREYDIKASELVTETKKRFIEVWHLQKKLELRQEMLKLSETFTEKIKSRITAGRTSPAELSRAELDRMQNRMALKRLEKERTASLMRLASLWGGMIHHSHKPNKIHETGDFMFNRVADQSEITDHLPSLDGLEKKLNGNPYLKHLDAEIDFRQSVVNLEKANRIPDLTVSAGVRHLNGSGSAAFTFGVSLPVPFFNKNQGAIKTAYSGLKKAESQVKAVQTNGLNRLNALYLELQTVHGNASMLKKEVLPKAAETLSVISNGYELGKFDYLNVLDANRTQLEVKKEFLEAIKNYWTLMADIDGLTGTGAQGKSEKVRGEEGKKVRKRDSGERLYRPEKSMKGEK